MCKACSDFWYECSRCVPIPNARGKDRPRLFFLGDTPCQHKDFDKPTIDIVYLAGISDFEHEEWYSG